jgi:thiol-disulfide isomerase/thioredoxin
MSRPTSMRVRIRSVLPVMMAALLLAACSAAASPTTVASPPTAQQSAGSGQVVGQSGAPQPAPTALQFTGTTIQGAPFSGASLAGKPVVLWFWAPWCTICRGEAPDVAKVAAEFSGRVAFVGIPGLGSVDEMKGFVSDTGTSGFTHVADVDGTLWARFGVAAQPAFVFVTRDGQSQEVSGSLAADQLRTAVNQLLAN